MLVGLAPACQAIWGIDTLSGDGNCVPCYSGPASTEDVGVCHGGCKEASGACQGEVTPSAEVCSTSHTNESCDGSPTCTGKLVFETAGLTFSVGDQYTAVAADLEGGVWATGTTREFLRVGKQFASGPPQTFPFLVHLAGDGSPRTTSIFVSSDAAFGWGIAVLPNGDPVIVGEFSGKLTIPPFQLDSVGAGGFIAAFDGATGDARWAKAFTTNDVGGVGLVVDVAIAPDGTILTCGSLRGPFIGPRGEALQTDGQSVLVARFDADGHEKWVKNVGPAGNHNCQWIASGADDSIAIAGSYQGHAWTFGSHLAKSELNDIPYVAALESDGTPRWSRALGGGQFGSPSGVGVDPATSDVVVGGSFTGHIDLGAATVSSEGQYDIFLARYRADGTPVSAKRFGDASEQILGAIRLDGAGQLLVTGQFDGVLDLDGCTLISSGGPDPAKDGFRDDAFVAKLSPEGRGIWCARGGTSKHEETGQSIASDVSGAVVVGGAFPTTFSFQGGGSPLVCSSDCAAGLFFARFTP